MLLISIRLLQHLQSICVDVALLNLQAILSCMHIFKSITQKRLLLHASYLLLLILIRLLLYYLQNCLLQRYLYSQLHASKRFLQSNLYCQKQLRKYLLLHQRHLLYCLLHLYLPKQRLF